MQSSRRDSTSERKREPNQEQLTSQPEPKPLEELGEGRRENEHCADADPERNQSSSYRPEEEKVTIREASTTGHPDSCVHHITRDENGDPLES